MQLSLAGHAAGEGFEGTIDDPALLMEARTTHGHACLHGWVDYHVVSSLNVLCCESVGGSSS